MRVLKLIALGLLGYALYEGYRLFYNRSTASTGGDGPQAGGGEDLHKALNADDAGRMSVLTGPAHNEPRGGRVVSTVDPDGGSTPTVVGRGVVHR